MSRSFSFVVAALVALLVISAAASAKTYVVTKRGDPVPGACKKRDCSLREAVFAANVNGGKDVIELPNRRKPYKLKQAGTGEDGSMTGDLDVSNNPLVIKHPGKGRATIDANGIDRAFEVFAGAPTTFRKLAITGGNATGLDSGGGIHSEAKLKVVASRIAGNSTSRRGGGINLADHAGLRLAGSAVAGNDADLVGGGIDTNDSSLVILRSRIVGNQAVNAGGGIFNDSASKPGLRIADTTIAGNRTDSDGGGVYLSGPAPLRITGSTISGNRSGRGGGLFATSAKPRLVNSTVSGNRATDAGGGIHARSGSEATLNAVTVARNVANADNAGAESGGGLYREDATSFEVGNSLIGLNRLGPGQRNDCAGNQKFDTLNNNLISTTAPGGQCDGFGPANGPKDILGVNPKIGKLKRNGGRTKTIALRKGSRAINGAKRSTAPKRDQRGKRRGRKPDIGAFER